MDPLAVLPAEVVLRILDFCSLSSLARLTCLNKSWQRFIDETHQDRIYSSRTLLPYGSRDLSFLDQSTSFARYFEGTISIKDLLKRRTLLDRNWNDERPVTRESVFQIGNDPVWRFRADFKRRFFVSTSQHGGIAVTDMDSARVLWRLPQEDVRPFAHLEYQDGVAVFDASGVTNAVQVWETDLEGLSRGFFRQTASLNHPCEIRGFELSHKSLCVTTEDGRSCLYDMTRSPPELKTTIFVDDNLVGHLCQSKDEVLYCVGKGGYHIYDKSSDYLLGTIEPKYCKKMYHIHHPEQPQNSIVSTGSALTSLPSVEVYPPKRPNRNRLTALSIVEGPFAPLTGAETTGIVDDEWGAALLAGSIMVGISRMGRVLVCPQWREAIQDRKIFQAVSYIIEFEGDESSFDIGGWLSVRDSRIMFEVQDQVYVVALGDDGNFYPPQRPSYCFSTSAATQLAVPVSFMALFDDCIMTTFSTLGWRRKDAPAQPLQQDRGIFPTKTIRILSLAPNLHVLDDNEASHDPESPSEVSEDTHAAILEIMDILSEEDDDESEDDSTDVS